jgi:hypothetical protein
MNNKKYVNYKELINIDVSTIDIKLRVHFNCRFIIKSYKFLILIE